MSGSVYHAVYLQCDCVAVSEKHGFAVYVHNHQVCLGTGADHTEAHHPRDSQGTRLLAVAGVGSEGASKAAAAVAAAKGPMAG